MALLQKYDHVIGLMKDVGNAVVALVPQMANVISRLTNLEDGIDDDFLGGWNAATNTPALAAGVGTQNKWYQVTVAGTQSITGVSQAFAVGDTIRFTPNGNKWVRIPYGGGGVSLVNGKAGAVTLVPADIGAAPTATPTFTGTTSISGILLPDSDNTRQNGSNGSKWASIWSRQAYIGDDAATNAFLRINGAAGTERQLAFSTAGLNRWRFRATAAAESGSEVGTDLILDRYSDAGSVIGSPLTVSRLTGMVTFQAPPKIPSYTVATLPSASTYSQCLVYVSNGASSKRLAISDGTNWRFPDGAIVS